MVDFTEQQVQTLAAIADAIISPLDEQEKAYLYQHQGNQKPIIDATSVSSEAVSTYLDFSGSSNIQAILDLFQQLRPDQQEQVQTVLNLLNISSASFLLTGYYKKFTDLTRNERQQVLLRWKSSTILSPLKGLYSTFTTLCMNAVYRSPECPAYKVIANGYGGRDAVRSQHDYHPTNVTDRLPMLTLEEAEKLSSFDTIIVGSGAGGGKNSWTLVLIQIGLRLIKLFPHLFLKKKNRCHCCRTHCCRSICASY